MFQIVEDKCLDDNMEDEEGRNIIKCGKYLERLDLYMRLDFPYIYVEKEFPIQEPTEQGADWIPCFGGRTAGWDYQAEGKLGGRAQGCFTCFVEYFLR